MQRREGGSSLELPQHRVIDQAMLPKLRSAMHDAMPDGGRRRHFGVGKKSCDADDGLPLVGNGCRLGEQAYSCRESCA